MDKQSITKMLLTPANISKKKTSDDDDRRIRHRLIRSLGIIQDTSRGITSDAASSSYRISGPASENRTAGTTSPHKNKILLKGRPLDIPLKEGTEDIDDGRSVHYSGPSSSSTSSPTRTSLPTRSSRCIQFKPLVQVIYIPSYQSYSERTKQLLWSSSNEIIQNAHRNMIEFAFEGWNVHAVLEEHDMVLDPYTSSFIHPVHLGGFCW